MDLNIFQSSSVKAFTNSSLKTHGVVNIQCPQTGKFDWAFTDRQIFTIDSQILLSNVSIVSGKLRKRLRREHYHFK
jgi:hypothetical protein